MNYIDLHVHSTASDGTFTPTQVVEQAIALQLEAIALSDHDTVAGVEEALTAAKGTSLEVIPAVELSCNYKNRELHILGLYIDHNRQEFTEELSRMNQARHQRNLDMLEKLNEGGYHITLEDLQEGNKDTVITRAHFARAIVNKGYYQSKDTVFKSLLGYDCPFYVPKPFISPETAIGYIRKAGGIAVLAHPMLYKFHYQEIEEIIKLLIPAGLQGIEAYHSAQNIAETDRLRSLALKYNLIVTGGSDFHGDNKPGLALGTGYGNLHVPAALFHTLKKLL